MVIDAGFVVRPVVYNESNSGGRAYAAYTIAQTGIAVTAIPGRLCKIHILGTGGTLGAITVYDGTGTGGTVVFGPTTPVIPAQGGLIYDLQMPISTGIFLVTAQATSLIVTYE